MTKNENYKTVAFRISPSGDFWRVIDFNGLAIIERKAGIDRETGRQKYDLCGEFVPTKEAIAKLKGFVFSRI